MLMELVGFLKHFFFKHFVTKIKKTRRGYKAFFDQVFDSGNKQNPLDNWPAKWSGVACVKEGTGNYSGIGFVLKVVPQKY